MKRGILVVGSLNMDMVVELNEMPLTGETVLAKGLSYKTGGKGANQACAAGKLGGEVRMLGCVGQDDFGHRQITVLKGAGVDTSYLKQSAGKPTGTALIYVDDHGDNSIVVTPGANQECDIAYLKEQDGQFEWCDYVVLQMEIPYEAVCYAAKRAKELGKTVILNPAPAPDSIPKEIFRLVDYITPNETELLKLAEVSDSCIDGMKKGAESLLKKGVSNIVITMGEQGALFVNGYAQELYPARKVKPADTTAAGDCFNGAFVVALAEGMDEGEAIRFANAASSIAVTRRGAQDSLPLRNELDDVLERG